MADGDALAEALPDAEGDSEADPLALGERLAEPLADADAEALALALAEPEALGLADGDGLALADAELCTQEPPSRSRPMMTVTSSVAANVGVPRVTSCPNRLVPAGAKS